MSGRLTAALYRTAWRCTRYLPTWLGYGLAHAGADVAWTVHRLRPTRTGVGQLERNLARLLPADTTARALHRASRSRDRGVGDGAVLQAQGDGVTGQGGVSRGRDGQGPGRCDRGG